MPKEGASQLKGAYPALLRSQMASKEQSRIYLKDMPLVQINIAKNWPLMQWLGIGSLSLPVSVTKELCGLASPFICLSLSCPSAVNDLSDSFSYKTHNSLISVFMRAQLSANEPNVPKH